MANQGKYINVPVLADQLPIVEKVVRPVKIGEKVERVKKHLLSSEYEDVVKPIFEDQVVEVPTGETSAYWADYVALCQSMDKTMNSLDAEGYDVVQITPITVAGHRHRAYSDCSTDWGYSFTKGAIITAKRRG
ncbi:hypothetical protein [Nitrospirillum bahiense]|uniref:Uncharacterized protein n=1 Tax=Nitrospirillum amazonense TaxID=28077 RepID=A0A560FMM9_9PROT|nr:hypothetical protein [Nitrospirillum amazonense]TWB22855.1 hypothetical protein FBZ88_1151 [Nitrospirillum amazonense]